ncbi:hypothetical protein Aduo_017714 [Ancylostoma duodenale]
MWGMVRSDDTTLGWRVGLKVVGVRAYSMCGPGVTTRRRQALRYGAGPTAKCQAKRANDIWLRHCRINDAQSATRRSTDSHGLPQ